MSFLSDEENIQSIITDRKRISVALLILFNILKNFKGDENLEILARIILTYSTRTNISTTFYYNSNILREIFNIYNRINKNLEGFENFLTIANQFDERLFHPSKAYAVYFAYQLKSYDRINQILNSYYIYTKSEGYNDSLDFCMFNFYKGLIFLSKQVNN